MTYSGGSLDDPSSKTARNVQYVGLKVSKHVIETTISILFYDNIVISVFRGQTFLYLHKVPTMKRFSNDRGHWGTNTSKDQEVFWTMVYGIKESFQAFSIVTLKRHTHRGRERVEWQINGNWSYTVSRIHQPALSNSLKRDKSTGSILSWYEGKLCLCI